MKRRELNLKLEVIYEELLEIISLYELTDCYNKMPEGMNGENERYLKTELIRIHQMADLLFVDKEINKKVWNIIDEVRYFTEQYERPGVVTRWKQINQNLIFYDCAFEMKQELPEKEYLQIQRGLSPVKLATYPDAELVKERELYFLFAKSKAHKKGKLFSEEKAFEEELIKTLFLVFNHDFELVE